MRGNGRSATPRRRPGSGSRPWVVAIVSCLFAAACAESTGGLGDANGGIGIAGGDGPVTETDVGARAENPQDEEADRPNGSASLPVGGPTRGDETTEPGAGPDRPDGEEVDEADRVHQALSAGVVPGLSVDDPFHETLAAYWALLHQARQEPWVYDEAELDAVAVGAGRDRFVQRVDNLGAAESVVAPEDSIFEVRLSGLRVGSDVAVGEECVVDDFVHLVVRDARTGDRYEPPLVTDDRVFTKRYGVTFQRMDAVWKVADRVLIDDREGVSGCARDW